MGGMFTGTSPRYKRRQSENITNRPRGTLRARRPRLPPLATKLSVERDGHHEATNARRVCGSGTEAQAQVMRAPRAMARKTAAKRKRQRIGRGRPPKDDQFLRDLALAAEVAYGLGPQQARDWAIALMEAQPCWPTKLPRGLRKAPAGSKLVGYLLPHTSFAGREASIRQKIKREGGARLDVVVALVRLLRAKDEDLLRHLQGLINALTPTVAE
jgi:hypothetical protein